jgi:hypothetical protein
MEHSSIVSAWQLGPLRLTVHLIGMNSYEEHVAEATQAHLEETN